jgi:hypothetical protein
MAEYAARAAAKWIEQLTARARRRLGVMMRAGTERTRSPQIMDGAVRIAAGTVTGEWLAELAAAARPVAVAGSLSPRRFPPPTRGARVVPPADPSPIASSLDPDDEAVEGTVLPARLGPQPNGEKRITTAMPPIAVLPLSAGVGAVRLPGAAGEAGTEDDLGVLAQRIKTILDEEARRFGIDV